jgi:hypothetical protein
VERFNSQRKGDTGRVSCTRIAQLTQTHFIRGEFCHSGLPVCTLSYVKAFQLYTESVPSAHFLDIPFPFFLCFDDFDDVAEVAVRSDEGWY